MQTLTVYENISDHRAKSYFEALQANKSVYLELSLKIISSLFEVANLSRKVIIKTINPYNLISVKIKQENIAIIREKPGEIREPAFGRQVRPDNH